LPSIWAETAVAGRLAAVSFNTWSAAARCVFQLELAVGGTRLGEFSQIGRIFADWANFRILGKFLPIGSNFRLLGQIFSYWVKFSTIGRIIHFLGHILQKKLKF
jgi:hypothetical protein